MTPKILFVAFSNSIHTARWMSTFADQGKDCFLFPSVDLGAAHPDLRSVKIYHSIYGTPRSPDPSVLLWGLPVFSETLAYFSRILMRKLFPAYQQRLLVSIIRKIKPDLIHSLEIQHAGYLTLAAKKMIQNGFPPWIVTNWGSDIYLFGRLDSHKEKIREVLENCDFYSCECHRDIELAERFGFRKKILPVFPNTGGFDLEKVKNLRSKENTSTRKAIMLKGYQGWAGRALTGLRALERCKEDLKGFELFIYCFDGDQTIFIASELFSKSTGIPVHLIPIGTPHEKILELHGRARISIGLSISDAISTSFLEALVMGSFPIQSWTSCANEWIKDGITGILVHPEDPDMIETAIKTVLSSNSLVDKASEENFLLAQERLDSKLLQLKVREFYTTALHQRKE